MGAFPDTTGLIFNQEYGGYGNYFKERPESRSEWKTETRKNRDDFKREDESMSKKPRIWKDAEIYTSFPISFDYFDECDVVLKEQVGSGGNNVSEGDMNLPYANKSNGRYVDAQGDAFPDLAAVCESVLEEEDSDYKEVLPYVKTSDGTYVDEEGDAIPDLAAVYESGLEKDDGDYKEVLPYAKTSDGTYVDEEGDEIPDLAAVCDSVMEVETVTTIGKKDIGSGEDMNLNDMGCLLYTKNTSVNDDCDEIPDFADYVGTRVAKVFKNTLYSGSVTKYLAPINKDDVPLWQIVYDDGDKEQWEISELKIGATLFKSKVELRCNDIMNKSHGGTCGVDCESDTSNDCGSYTNQECGGSDSDNSMDGHYEYDAQRYESDSDFVISSSDESVDHVSIVIDYYFIYLFTDIYVCLCRFLL